MCGGFLITKYGVSQIHIYFLAVKESMSASFVLQTSICLQVELAERRYALYYYIAACYADMQVVEIK